MPHLFLTGSAANTAKSQQFKHPTTGVWAAGTKNNATGKYEVTHLDCAVGSYGPGHTPLLTRLEGTTTEYAYTGAVVEIVGAGAATLIQVVYFGDSQEGESLATGNASNLKGFYSPRNHRGYALDQFTADTPTTGITAADFRSDSSSGRAIIGGQDFGPALSGWLSEGNYGRRYLYFGGAINNLILNNETAQQIYDRKKGQVQAAKAAYPDVRVVVPTLAAAGRRYQATASIPAVNAVINSYNSLVRNGKLDIGYDLLLDVAAYKEMQDPKNEEFFQDRLHHPYTGEKFIGRLVATAIEQYEAGTYARPGIQAWDGVTPTDNSAGYEYLGEYYAETPGNTPAIWLDSSGRNKHLIQTVDVQQLQQLTVNGKVRYNIPTNATNMRFVAPALSGYRSEYVISVGLKLNDITFAQLCNFDSFGLSDDEVSPDGFGTILGLNASEGAGGVLFQTGVQGTGNGVLNVPNNTEVWVDYHLEEAGAWVEVSGVIAAQNKVYVPTSLFCGSSPAKYSLGCFFNSADGPFNQLQAQIHTLLVKKGRMTGAQTAAKRNARAAELGLNYGSAVATSPNP